jgi:hypothetical protein
MPMTPQQAVEMITNVEKAVKAGEAKPDSLVRACNLVAREAIGWAINAQKRDTMLLNGLNEVRAAAGLPPLGARSGAAHPAGAVEAAPAAPVAAPMMPGVPNVPRGPNGLRLNVDGTEMDAQQSAIEDQMDAATAAGIAAGEIQQAPGHTPFVPPSAAPAPAAGAAPAAPELPQTAPDGTPISVPVPG